MTNETFRRKYLDELLELQSVEAQLVEAMPRLRDMAQDADLSKAIDDHLQETRHQLERVEGLVRRHDAAPGSHTDSGLQALIGEAAKWAEMERDPQLRDVALIASLQRIEHYEMAVYGTLAAWAKTLHLDDDRGVLHEILEEEKAADLALSRLAEGRVNPGAVA